MLLALVLCACAAEKPVPVQAPPGAVLLEENRAAADRLAASAVEGLGPGARVLVAAFVRMDDLSGTSDLGRLLAAQFASSLSAAGLEVVEVRLRREMALREGQGEFALSRRAAELAAGTQEAHAVLVGSYAAESEAVFVSARVVRLENGGVVGALEYALPGGGLAGRMAAGEEHDAAFRARVAPAKVALRGGELPEPLAMPPLVMPSSPFANDEPLLPQFAPPAGQAIENLEPPRRLN